ncbi:MAG: diguanylate cyclase [Clostridiales bacterium]|jgi:diguanylate cyclase (GGDEF)-like protein|nr:diguanylate cyclase [Clostridiales bacterium]
MPDRSEDAMVLISKKELVYISKLVENLKTAKPMDYLLADPVEIKNSYLQDVQKNILILNEYTKELSAYSLAIAHGDLDVEFPTKHNYLSGGLKELHSNLLHLSWKVNQVSEGNFNQKIDFMGQISDSFNNMIRGLIERDARIEELILIIDVINQYTNINMYVHDQESGQLLYDEEERKSKKDNKGAAPEDENTLALKKEFADMLYKKMKEEDISSSEWDVFSEYNDKWYHVYSLLSKWTDDKRAYFHILVDISNQKMLIENLEFQVSRDQMTGIYNHKFAVNTVQKFISTQNPFTICFIDLDGLKTANDVHGHQWGDKYLLKFIEIVNASTRNKEYFCRVGGDEFILIFPEVGPGDMLNIVNRISDNVAVFNQTHEFPFKVSFSFGIEAFDKNIHTDAKAMMTMADNKMYILKRGKYINFKKI